MAEPSSLHVFDLALIIDIHGTNKYSSQRNDPGLLTDISDFF